MPSTLYLATCKDWGDTIKIGTTEDESRRKWDYYTYVKHPVCYIALFRITSSLPIPLNDLDHFEFPDWMKMKGRGDEHVKEGGGTEFWNLVKRIETVTQFLTETNITFELYEGDPYPIRPTSVRVRTSTPISSTLIIESAPEISLKERFQQLVFKKGETFRSIQEELWDKFTSMLLEGILLRGIVQWPTGVGKTIAILILFVLSYDAHKKRTPRTPFRGLFISPTNDIISTLKLHIDKLSAFGLKLLYGNEGKLKTLTLPETDDYILITTHASLTTEDMSITSLPRFTHIHYDEAHHVTGDIFFNALKSIETEIPIITGTSATPLTSSAIQHERFHELFGTPTNIISRCEVEYAVQQQWISPPKFTLSAQNPLTPSSFITSLREEIQRVRGSWKGGKLIAYVPTLNELTLVYLEARRYPDWTPYIATPLEYVKTNEHSKQRQLDVEAILKDAILDDVFVDVAPTSTEIHVLFACKRYREGADIKGIDMTAVWMGETISAYILLQIIGRAMRYEGDPSKIGRCMILRGSLTTESTNEIFDNILIDIQAITGDGNGASNEQVRVYYEQFIEHVYIDNRVVSKEESIERIQRLFERKPIRDVTLKELKAIFSKIPIQDILIKDVQRLLHENKRSLPKHGLLHTFGKNFYQLFDIVYIITKEEMFECLKKYAIKDALDFDEQWSSLHRTNPVIPGIPEEWFGYSFWQEMEHWLDS
jgi:superfamily II DNA or RNA helicase